MNYRKEMLRTLKTSEDFHEVDYLLNAALGLTGESGEVADLIKKHLFQDHALDKEKLIKELGDVRFYLEVACYALGVTIEEVEEANSLKLRKRYPNGFNAENSTNRVGD